MDSLENQPAHAPRGAAPGDTLRVHLVYEPKQLQFGTSGRRGKVADLSQLEVYLNVVAEVHYLQSLPPQQGGILRGDEFYFARDLRPSATMFVAGQQGRGRIAQAVERAIGDAGMRPVNLGPIPTPALAHYAFMARRGSIMVTGSHIPFDRNGYKLNRANGELLKEHEAPITAEVCVTRERLYEEPFCASLFDEFGRFKEDHPQLSDEIGDARATYLARYLEFFARSRLRGARIVVYQHSAVGRDLLVELLECLGAEAIPAGRSDEFVPIDTENIDSMQMAFLQKLADQIGEDSGPVDAIVSTDGDSDRPLLLAVEPETGHVRFFPGDLLGMVVAEYLQADSVVVPISCNDALDHGRLARMVEPKTRIGSPYVIAGMERAREKGAKIVCGWEANGGFLTGSDIIRNGAVLSALPTRDAFLPLLCVLFSAHEKRIAVTQVFDGLPRRFSRAGLLRGFDKSTGDRLVDRFSPEDRSIREVTFETDPPRVTRDDETATSGSEAPVDSLRRIRSDLERRFSSVLGFGPVRRINYIDGVRISFANRDVAHFRPSGNADELRIYAVADTEARAERIVKLCAAEPDGILRNIEKGF